MANSVNLGRVQGRGLWSGSFMGATATGYNGTVTVPTQMNAHPLPGDAIVVASATVGNLSTGSVFTVKAFYVSTSMFETTSMTPDYIITGEYLTVAFTATGWTTVNNMYGAYAKTVSLPSGKQIVAVYEGTKASPTPRGTFSGNVVYANAMFNGFVLIG